LNGLCNGKSRRRGTRIVQKRFAASATAPPNGRELPSKDPEAGLLHRAVLVIIPISPQLSPISSQLRLSSR
jgi:hypothetical protein